jgi:wyosine [tRNA(Phe)-imidazoG37] synthetase (radical SAM superfamily)
MIIMEEEKLFKSVYGPLKSWRYGKSLGIDPIGKTSVCSFNCVYCQLGEIEIITKERRIFVPTETILNDLKSFAPWNEIDIITLSGSGEPTLALNLGEILKGIKKITNHQTLVLTNVPLSPA